VLGFPVGNVLFRNLLRDSRLNVLLGGLCPIQRFGYTSGDDPRLTLDGNIARSNPELANTVAVERIEHNERNAES
jgi:hypothetical protein